MSAPGRIVDAIRSFKLHSIYVRNFLISAGLILLPLIGLNIFLYRVSQRMATDEAALLSQNALRVTRDIFDSIFKEVDYLSASLSLDPETELFALSENADSILSQDPVRTIAARLKTSVYSNAYIHSMYVYADVSDSIVTHIGLNDLSTFEDTGWHDAYLDIKENKIRKTFRKIYDIYPYVITVIKPLYVVGGDDKHGAVVININVDELQRVLLDPDPNSTENLYVIDSDGTIVFATHADDLGKSATEINLYQSYDEESVIFSEAASNYYSWKFVSIHALNTYNLQSSRLRSFVTVVLILSIFTTFAAAFFISTSTYRPIRRILAAIEDPEHIQLLDRKSDEPNNETKYIAAAIARFTHTNGTLRDELHRQLSELDQARTEALQLQINPHFLNNTLEAISMSARRLTTGDNELTRMVSLLSKLLQISLESGENIVPLSEEIEHARIYLEILSIRYDGRFDVTWEIPEELLSFGMLRLSLQPLIENAFYHGIKPTRTKGAIMIGARAADGERDLLVSVSNTGKSISGSAMSIILRALGSGFEISSEHIGMRNVDQRAKLVFGSKYGLSIESSEQAGTTVTIRIPVVAAD